MINANRANIIINRQCMDSGFTVPCISRNAMQVLQDYSWPGNVRELDNTCERALLVSGGSPIEVEHLPAHILESLAETGSYPERAAVLKEPASTQHSTIDQAYSDVISNALARYHGNLSKVAAHLGIARSTLYRKMRKLNLLWKESL
jgi:sigma-54 dependent transcriptional regulator, acetoin dehydrogenase operon transcriptional activator AcoR